MTDLTVVDDIAIVRRFLVDLAEGRIDAALAAMSDDVEYTNVGLATLRGRRGAARALNLLGTRTMGFEVELTSVAAENGTVLTERVDELRIGPLRIRFWVCGRFDVRGGRIVLWRDYFDNVDVVKGLVRGVLALAIPRAQRTMTPIER